MPEQKDAAQNFSREHIMFAERSGSAKSFSFLCSGSGRIDPFDLPVDTTKFLGTAIKNKSGLEFRRFLVKNAASFQAAEFLLETVRRQDDTLELEVK